MKISVRIETRTRANATGQRNHDMRTGRQPSYVDPARSNLNSVIYAPEPTGNMLRECEERRKRRETKRAMRTDAAIAISGIITFDKEAAEYVKNLSIEEQDKLFLQSARDVAESMGTTLTGLVVHRDEFSPHAHFQCPAVRLDGYPVSKGLDRESFSKLQDVAAVAWADHGIERGEKKTDKVQRLRNEGKTVAEITAETVHRSVKQLHEDLPLEIANRERESEELKAKLSKNRDLLRKVESDLAAGKISAEKAAKRMEAYQRRAAEAENALAGKFSLPEPKPARDWMGRKKKDVVEVPSDIAQQLRKDAALYADEQNRLARENLERRERDLETERYEVLAERYEVQAKRDEVQREWEAIRKAQENFELLLNKKLQDSMAMQHSEIKKREELLSEYARQANAKIAALGDERLSIGISLARIFGIENPSMNREKAYKAVLDGNGNLNKTRELIEKSMYSPAAELGGGPKMGR